MTNDEINFDGNTDVPQVSSDNGLSASDFLGGNFLKNPPVGETLLLNIVKVEKSDKTTAKNKETGKEFSVGLKQRNGVVKRYDIVCVDGTYTVSNWEIFFKLFGPKGLLIKYAKDHNGSFAGAKVNIKRLIDGGYANYKVADLAKILNITPAETEKVIADIKQAIKEQRLFEVTEVA